MDKETQEYREWEARMKALNSDTPQYAAND